MPSAYRRIPEAVIERAREVKPDCLESFPDGGFTVGLLASLVCEHLSLGTSQVDHLEDSLWVWESFRALSDVDPAAALDCLALAVAQSTDPDVLGGIAAGPLADLIVDHGLQVMEGIEDLAQEQARFRSVLTGVWPCGQDEGAEVWQRVLRARAAGPRLDRTHRVPDWVWG